MSSLFWGVILIVLFGSALIAAFLWHRRSITTSLCQIESFREQIRQTLETSQQRLDVQLRHQIEQWQQTHRTVGDRLEHVSRTMGGLETKFESRMVKLEEITKHVFDVGKDIASLQQILRAPKLRGGIGEYLLGDLLAQMLPQAHYELQYLFANGDRVDAVIRTAQGLVPIDAKFPLENFRRLAAASDDAERRGFRKAFLLDVRKHIDAIAGKYIQPAAGTLEFAFMYIPAENVYYEVILKEPEETAAEPPANYALRHRVIPVSPNSFYAYLHTVLFGLRGLQVQAYVGEILKELSELRRHSKETQKNFGVLGRHLQHALVSFQSCDKELGKLTGRLDELDRPIQRDTASLEGTAETPPLISSSTIAADVDAAPR